MRKTVFAVFGCVEPLLAAGSELLHNFVGRYRVPRRSTAVRVRARCYAHACAPLGQFLRKPASRSSGRIITRPYGIMAMSTLG